MGKFARWRWPMAAVVILAAVLALTACSTTQPRLGEGFPDYAYRSAQALKGYQIAVAEGELLARMPCYCGCGQDPRYKNLRDCFIDDGAFNSHAANCQVCLEEAEDAVDWKGQDLTTKEVRERIDQKYEGRGRPTETPPVAE